MRVAAYYTDERPISDFYRVKGPAEAAAQQGVDVTLERFALAVSMRPGTSIVDAVTPPPDVDVIVLPAPLETRVVQAIPLLQAAGIAVVVDVDDYAAAVHPGSITFESVHRPDHNFRNHLRACRGADLVTVTTPALAAIYGTHGRVRVLPNYVPAEYLTVEHDEHDPPRVGWAGSVNVHPADLQVTRGAVARAIDATDATFHQIGPPEDVAEKLDLTKLPTATGWFDFYDYPELLAELDVGIVPLTDTAFNRSKSALKVCEMASVGVPAVVSPTPDNVRMAKLGVGIIANRPREWERQLGALITNHGRRRELAEQGRQVMAGHTIEGNAWRWAEAWADAFSNHRARVHS